MADFSESGCTVDELRCRAVGGEFVATLRPRLLSQTLPGV